MDPVRVGRTVRVLRLRLGWRQADLAARASVSQQTVSDIERGRAATVGWRRFERVVNALDARVDIVISWRGAALDRLLDERHAALSVAFARRLRLYGYEALMEVTYSIFGERGSVDVLGWRAADRALVVSEVKADVASAEGTTRKHDEKIRLARAIARERFGVEPSVVIGVLVVAESSTARRRIDRHREVFASAYPARGHAAWALVRTGRPGRGLVFLSSTPVAGARRVSATRRAA